MIARTMTLAESLIWFCILALLVCVVGRINLPAPESLQDGTAVHAARTGR